jgi:hypothetical protein
MAIARWTPAEYEIVRACTVSEAMARLPHRTKAAIRSARKKLKVGIPHRPWTKVERRKLQKYCHEPLSKLAPRFKNRSIDSVRHQKSCVSGTPGNLPWKTTDLPKLKKLFRSAPRADLLSAYPGRTWSAIRHQAHANGFRRAICFATAPNELREAVRIRSREDKIPLGQLGAQTGCGAYFKDGGGKRVDLNKIDRAVEFFGGKMAIDWQDE